MIPIGDGKTSRVRPVVTWTLLGLNVLVFLLDRSFNVFETSLLFPDLAMRPDEITAAITGRGDPVELTKIYTSMFLHGNLAHLLGNLLFLWIFGDNVERALGGLRYALYYVFWGVAAATAQVFVDPLSPIPIVGASGAIGGVLGAYFLLYPANRVTVIIPPLFFWPFMVPAWLMLGLWFVFQIVFPMEGVANWAHAGGFLAGMLTIMALGGRDKVLEPIRKEEWEERLEAQRARW